MWLAMEDLWVRAADPLAIRKVNADAARFSVASNLDSEDGKAKSPLQ